MKHAETAVDRDHRFTIGRDLESGRHYLSIPVSNRLCDYEEYYEIAKATHDAYPANLAELIAFAEQHLADFKVPQYLIIRQEMLPRNPGGKILKPALRNTIVWDKPLR